MNPADTMAELGAAISRREARCAAVSAWSVGEHIDHTCQVISAVTGSLAGSRPFARVRSFRLLAWVVLATGFIPRGRGRAPAAVMPRQGHLEQALRVRLAEADADLARVPALSPGCWFEHPVFGVLPRDAAVRFIHIHTAHHLRIIRDILRRVR